jgi:hypothetical protein
MSFSDEGFHGSSRLSITTQMLVPIFKPEFIVEQKGVGGGVCEGNGLRRVIHVPSKLKRHQIELRQCLSRTRASMGHRGVLSLLKC